MNHRSAVADCPSGNMAKSSLKSILANDEGHGLIACVDGVPAGWCGFDPVNTQIGHDYNLQNKVFHQSGAWMIHCLYIDPKFRNQGLSKALINAAMNEVQNQNAHEVIAFPIPEESKGKFPKDIAEFSGRISTFLELSFTSRGKINEFNEIVGKVF